MSAEGPTRVPVVIIGAGPTGVTAATLLAQYGVDCLILDRWSQVYRQPRAVHLDDEVFRILARLGIADEFEAISRPALGLRLVDANMTVLAEFARDTRLSRNGFPQANMFDQPDLEELLRANLENYPRVELRGDVEFTDLVEDGDGRVRVSYADRTDGSEHTVVADYVLGCDGANSVTRTRMGSRMQDLGFAQRWLVVDGATTADLNQWDGVHQVCDQVRAGTYMRIADTRYRWEFRLLDGETVADFDTPAKLAPLLKPWIDGTPCDDVELVRVAEYTFRAQLADTWRRGPVFLLGDAAHLTPPFIGQGMGAGIRDAMNLAWKLAGVLDGSLPAEALDTYQRERKSHSRSLIHEALGVGRVMTSGGQLGSLVRRVALPRLHRVPGVSARILDSGTPALRRSALNHTTRMPWHLAGTLCPNPVVDGDERLDAQLGRAFGVITSTAPRPMDRALIARRGAVLHLAAPGTELARWLHRGHASAAIVRPDRTVMTAGRDLAALCDVLPRSCPAPSRETVVPTRPTP
ncbi:MAG: bifunctional 3-(3-hydroxy-phenyl)propionate/3-hydroxycinnamic acid hydroxylase [Mycobacterium sp.]